VSEKSEVRLRRAPKLPVFLVLGALVGFFATLIVTSLFPADPKVGFVASFGYFLLFGIPAGVVLGAVVGLIIDRVSIARARTVTVEREVVGDVGDADA
jgi:NhaP-type Na+/H+ or K+/H+ antiporter